MTVNSKQPDKNKILRVSVILVGVLVNVLLSFAMDRLGLPLFLDTVGTIAVAATCGFFPGILTGIITNAVCIFYNSNAFYYAVINGSIAIFAAWAGSRKRKITIPRLVLYVSVGAVFSGVASSLIQWGILGEPQHSLISDNAESFASAADIHPFVAFLLINIIFNFIDKGIATGVTAVLYRFAPKEVLKGIKDAGWKQRAPEDREVSHVKEWGDRVRYSVRKRITFTMIVTSLVLVVAMGWIGLRLFYTNMKQDRAESAMKTARFAAKMIDAERIDEFIASGWNLPEYKETYDLLYQIWETSDVTYLYALKVEEKGCRFIFDMDTEDPYYAEESEAYEPGDFVKFEEAFKPYLPDLYAGKEVGPIESTDTWGWLLTVYSPVTDASGNCVCYVGADVSIEYMADYMRQFVLKVTLMLAGLFMLITAFAMWVTDVYTAFPVSSIAACVDRFADAGDKQDKLDENVKEIRALDIRTNDEIEKLYHAICRMTLSQAERVRDIKRLSEATLKMQDGLVITMANMVESRDSDTGAHVQKTSAYVKIIVEGLKKKGYYAEKITPKFISDVVRSAPLHDVGKINIPDEVLNKPGKLTDEEYEIMKTHTTAGKALMEHAIGTVEGGTYLKEARNMAAYHHERWDGKGYPEQLHGEVIPLSARIMAVADVFDALTSPRVYKPAFPLDKALSIIQEGSGTQFDPKCVEVFMDSLPEVKVVLKKYNQNA